MKLSGAANCRAVESYSPMTLRGKRADMLPAGGLISGRDAVLEQ